MRIDSFNNNLIGSQNTPSAGISQPRDIRVSFDPITRQDMTLSGMRSYMMRQLGVGGNVNLTA